VQVHPTAENNFGAKFMEVRCKCSAPLDGECAHPRRGGARIGGEESHFCWVEDGVAFNLEGLGRIS